MLDATDVGRMVTVFIEGGFNFTGVVLNVEEQGLFYAGADFVDKDGQQVWVRQSAIVLVHRHPEARDSQ